MKPLSFHPLANIFPPMEGAAFDDFVADIRAHGLNEPIVMLDGLILDGRNRYRACLAADVPVRTRPFDGDDPLAFIISANLHRRHLDESQRAMTAAKLASTNGRGRPAKNTAIAVIPQDQAAKKLNVSVDSLQRATKVLQRGTPELIAAVEQGVMKVSAAAGIVRRTPAQQIARIERDRLKATGEIRQSQDWYRTPPEAVEMLIAAEAQRGGFAHSIRESACGDGAISRVFEAHGHTVVSTDLHDRGYGESGIDFLAETDLRAEDMVTNPPYDDDMPEKFVLHALALGARKVA